MKKYNISDFHLFLLILFFDTILFKILRVKVDTENNLLVYVYHNDH